MTLKIRIPRAFLSNSGRGMTALAAASAPTGATFHAMLTDCMDEWVVEGSTTAVLPRAPQTSREVTTKISEATASPAPTKGSRVLGPSRPSPLARAWSWLHSRSAFSATKRLRVSETVSLGEKRFVALVSVEGREFLIGGGAAGVSLLSALGTTPGNGKSAAEDSE